MPGSALAEPILARMRTTQITAALLCGMTPVSGHGERAAVCLLERVNASSLTWPGSTGASEAGRTIGGRRSRYSD
jgi:hypothetical protein